MTLGINSILYRNTGSNGSPTWAAMNDVDDLKVDPKWDTAAANTRGSKVNRKEPTGLEIEITGKIQATGGTDYLAFQTAFYGRASVDVLCIDGTTATNGAEGVRFDAKIGQWGEDQARNNVNYRDFSLYPCISVNAPSSVVVTTGAPVFTAI